MEIVVSFFALVVSIAGFLLSIFTHFQILRRDRKQATLEAYNRLESEALEKLDMMMPADIKEIVANSRTKEYSGKYKELTALAARIEHFCVGVEQGIYDRKVVYELGHGFLDDRIMKRIEPLIDMKDHGASKSYYENTRKVVSEMKKMSGKCFL